jgi:serine/threonine protein kinase
MLAALLLSSLTATSIAQKVISNIAKQREANALLLQTLFKNRYYVVSKVGAGGFGSVYKARDIQSGDRLVALKEVSLLGLHPQAMIGATTALQREVSVLSRLDHPNLPRLYEHFQNPGHWYLVMDFIAGETLEQYQSKEPDGRLLLRS